TVQALGLTTFANAFDLNCGTHVVEVECVGERRQAERLHSVATGPIWAPHRGCLDVATGEPDERAVVGDSECLAVQVTCPDPGVRHAAGDGPKERVERAVSEVAHAGDHPR